MNINKEQIKQEAIQLLEQGVKIEIRWDAGNDDCIFEYYLNTHQVDHLKPWQDELATYIMIELELPGVGEYCVLGEAELLLNGGLVLKYLNKDNEHILETFGDEDDPFLEEEEEFNYYKDSFMGEEEDSAQIEQQDQQFEEYLPAFLAQTEEPQLLKLFLKYNK